MLWFCTSLMTIVEADVTKTPTVKEIAKKNPKVKVAEVRKATEALQKLHSAGFQPAAYNLSGPFSPRHACLKSRD